MGERTQLVKIAVYIEYSLLSPTSPAKQSYVKITYTGRCALAYENGYDGDSAAVKRPYRPALYRRSHTHVYIRTYISTCKNCKVYFEHFMNLRAVGRSQRRWNDNDRSRARGWRRLPSALLSLYRDLKCRNYR